MALVDGWYIEMSKNHNKFKFKISKNTQIILGVLVLIIGLIAISYNYLIDKRDRVFDLMNIEMFQSETPMDVIGMETGDIENDDIEDIETTNNTSNNSNSSTNNNNTNNNKNNNNSNNNNSSKNNQSTTKKNSSQYKYVGILEIPKISLKKGFLDINSKYNSIDYNVTVIKTSTYPDVDKGNFILAAHSGTASISYFKNLYKLKKGDTANIYYKNKKYVYKIVKIYDQPKTGKLSIYRDYSKTTLTLITCTKDNKKTQTLYILELTKTSKY